MYYVRFSLNLRQAEGVLHERGMTSAMYSFLIVPCICPDELEYCVRTVTSDCKHSHSFFDPSTLEPYSAVGSAILWSIDFYQKHFKTRVYFIFQGKCNAIL